MATGGPVNEISFRKSALAVFLILYAIGAMIYSNSLLAPFYFDDLDKIIENPRIRLTRLTWPEFREIGRGQPVARLLPMITFAANYHLDQYRPSGYRMVNIFVHIITGWLVFCLAWQTLRLNGRQPLLVSLAAALLWLTQPTHTQSVTYIVQRMNSMATMFYLLSVICYIQGRKLQIKNASPDRVLVCFAGCGLAGLLGLTCKETVATLPLFLFLYEWYFFQRLNRLWLKRNLPWLVLLAAASGLIIIFCLGAHPLERLSYLYRSKPFSLTQRLLTQPRTVLYYLSLLVFPFPDRLMLVYDFPLSNTLADPVINIPAIIALAALLLLAFFSAGKHRLLSFAVLWFLGNLVIESSVINLALAFEHRLYLPSIFPVLAAVAGLSRYVKPGPLAIAIAVALIAGNAFSTYQRNFVWQDRVTFWGDNCAKAPGLSRPRNDYGLAMAEAGKTEAAAVEYKKALALSGEKAPVHNNLGILYYQDGDIEKAEAQFLQAVREQSTFAKAFTNMGIIKSEKGEPEEALGLLKTAVLLDPDDADAHNALGQAYYASKRTEPAIRHFQRALELDPGNINAENNLGAILLGIGNAEQAVFHLRRALAISPGHPEANINIGIAYGRLNDPAMAVFHLFRAVFLTPDSPAARTELGRLLLNEGKLQDARTFLESALALRPGYIKARLALAAVLEEQKLTDEAIAQYRKILADDPDNAPAKEQLARLLNNDGQRQRP